MTIKKSGITFISMRNKPPWKSVNIKVELINSNDIKFKNLKISQDK